MTNTKELRTNIQELERKLECAKRNLRGVIEDCNHNYTPIVYDPIIEEAYTIPGDAPGTMGVDWRGPVYVPRKETPRWRRECNLCGNVEYTEETKEEIKKQPIWPEDFRRRQ